MYIRVQELEWIFTHYNGLKALLQELEIEAEAVLCESEGETIYGNVMRRTLDGMPIATGRISDRTGEAVVNIHKLSRLQREAIEEINEDTLHISMILQSTEIALRRLSSTDRKIVELKLSDRVSWNEIAKAVNCSTQTARQRYREAIARMTAVSRIELDSYLKMKKMFEFN